MIDRYVTKVTLYKKRISVEIKIKKDHPDNDPNGRGYHGGPEEFWVIATTKACSKLAKYKAKSTKLDTK
jgi:hypothetical protein